MPIYLTLAVVGDSDGFDAVELTLDDRAVRHLRVARNLFALVQREGDLLGIQPAQLVLINPIPVRYLTGNYDDSRPSALLDALTDVTVDAGGGHLARYSYILGEAPLGGVEPAMSARHPRLVVNTGGFGWEFRPFGSMAWQDETGQVPFDHMDRILAGGRP